MLKFTMVKDNYIFDAEAFLNDVNKRLEQEELMVDFSSFLSYIITRRIKLTPKCRWIPRKHVYAINALLKNPLQLDDKIGDRVYKMREECDASRIYFIDLLAEASECIIADGKDVLIKGPTYGRFMNMNTFSKKQWLILAWYFHLDWHNWLPQGDFGKTLQVKNFKIVPYLKQWFNARGMISFKDFAKDLINSLGLKWNAPSQNFACEFMEWGIIQCILRPLNWFDVIELQYEKEDEAGVKSIKGFYLKFIGKLFLEKLVEMGERIKADEYSVIA